MEAYKHFAHTTSQEYLKHIITQHLFPSNDYDTKKHHQTMRVIKPTETHYSEALIFNILCGKWSEGEARQQANGEEFLKWF